MSYGRNPYYIWSDGERLWLNGIAVPESIVNAFLYKVLLKNRRQELAERLRNGKQQWMRRWHFDDNFIEMHEVTPENNQELAEYVKWMESQEDEVLKTLMQPQVQGR